MIKNIVFIRHAKLKGDIFDNRRGVKFIGIKEDPDIISPPMQDIEKIRSNFKNFELFLSSPMKRCKETLSLITYKKIVETPILLEINYGDAEGLYFEDIKKKYPYLFEAWDKGEDPNFPNGENNLKVVKRVKLFINSLSKVKQDNILVCTHNVFLRCLFGSSLKIPVKYWYKIQIPYFEPLHFVLERNNIKYAGDEEQKKRILKDIFPKRINGYFIALIPEEKVYSTISKVKKEIFQIFGNQKYLKDPPHCTLYVSLTEDLEEINKKIQKISLGQKKISAEILNKYKEFEDDKFAGGGTSLALKFDNKANNNIISLQKKIINSLNELIGGKIHPRYRDKIISQSLKENVQKYGFPFVGDIFIPHINFCCFNPPENAEKFKELFPIENFSGNMKFTKLALYKLYPDDKIELINEFKLQ